MVYRRSFAGGFQVAVDHLQLPTYLWLSVSASGNGIIVINLKTQQPKVLDLTRSGKWWVGPRRDCCV